MSPANQKTLAYVTPFDNSLFTARQTLLPTYPSPHRPHVKYVLSILDNSITQPYPKPASRASQFEQRLIILDDTPDADLLAHLADACDWIDACRARADGAVLVHCHLGQSRSAAVVVAYVMRADRVPLARALERVRRRRAVVRPNPGFVAQLELWEGMAYDVWEDVEVEVEVDVAAVDCDKQNENESASDPVVDQPQPKHTVRRRKQAYDTWKTEQEKRTKRFLENLA